MTNDDMELVREYAARQSENAFTALVSRHVHLVHSTAFRQVRDPHVAEEITQTVFIILARKAGSLGPQTIVSGWLYRTTIYVASASLKIQRRRERREQKAFMQSIIDEVQGDPAWERLAPLLDDAMARLRGSDRDALVLRFFENKNFKAVGDALGVDERAAQKRVARALEKLRGIFAKGGVHSTSAIIAGAIAANGIKTAPVEVVRSALAAALGQGASAGGSTLTLLKGTLKLMALSKAKIAATVATSLLFAAGVTTVAVKQIEARRQLRDAWRVPNLTAAIVDRTPAQVRILPTKFPGQGAFTSGNNNEKRGAVNVGITRLVAWAYDWPSGRLVFPEGRPKERFDFIATLPYGNARALQKEVEKVTGLAGHRQTMETSVLVLKVRQPNAAGLQPAIEGSPDLWWGVGNFRCGDQPISSLVEYLEDYFWLPVIDETGLSEKFHIDVKWAGRAGDTTHATLKQALIDQLGLELVPDRRPVEMLVMGKAH